MARDRDVTAFDRRAAAYESGLIGRMHHDIVERGVDIALTALPAPRRVLDIGCGTGALLRLLADRLRDAETLVGIDPAPNMIRTASSVPDLDRRIRFAVAAAERLPFADRSFDLVISTTSFDHWADQGRGLRECARVVRPGGPLVLTDLFSAILLPTMVIGRRGKARTVGRATALLTAAGFRAQTWHPSFLLRTVVATT